MSLLNLLKGQAGELAQIFGPVIGEMADRLERLERAVCESGKAQRDAVQLLSREYGGAVEGYEGYNPFRLPRVLHVNTENGPADPLRLRAALGRKVSRGFIHNRGEATAVLYYVVEEPGQENRREGPVFLSPGMAVDISFALDILEVEENTESGSSEGPVKVQVQVQ